MVLKCFIVLLTLIPSPDAAILGALYYCLPRNNIDRLLGNAQQHERVTAPGLHCTQSRLCLVCRVNRDLGQFERFRRVFHTPHYSVLLSHVRHATLSSLQVRCIKLASCMLKSQCSVAWQASPKKYVTRDVCRM